MKTSNILLIGLLIIIILFVSYYNEYSNQNVEGFTPYLKKMVRPHMRKMRMNMEGLYTKHTTKLNNMLKRNNLL